MSMPLMWCFSGMLLGAVSQLMQALSVELNIATFLAALFVSIQPVIFFLLDDMKASRKKDFRWSINASTLTFSGLFLLINVWPQAVVWYWIAPAAAFSSLPFLIIGYVILVEEKPDTES